MNAAHRSWWIVALLLVALAGAGAVAWHWLGDDSSIVGGGRRARSPSTPAADERPDPAHAVQAAQRESEKPAAAEAEASGDVAAGAAFRYGVPLTVVRHEDGVPIGGALLFVLDARKVDRKEIFDLARDPSELRRRSNLVLKSDKEGLAQVPRPVSSTFVVGLAEGRRGVIGASASTFGALRLELFKPLEVAVRVVDGEGRRTAGVEVALAEAEHALLESPLHATTDSEGEARIADLELEEVMQSPSRKVVVGFAFPNLPPATVTISADPPPTEPVVLTLPATGAVTFHLVDEDGAGLSAAGFLRLSALGAADSSGDANRKRGDRRWMRIALDERGRGAAPQVGLGLDLLASPSVPERATPTQRFSGPTRTGETIDVALPAGAIGPVLTGHAAASDGTPLAGADLNAQFDAFDPNGKLTGSDRADATIDGDGGFRLDFSHGRQKGRDGRLFLRATRDGGSPVEATTDLTMPATGIDEVGTVKLAPPPLIASGTVVDDESVAIEGALVTIDVKLDAPPPFKVNHLPSATTAADGRFELRGELPDGSLSLRAQRGGYLPMKPLSFIVGASDLLLTLRMGGTLAGSIVLPDDFPGDLLFARLELPGSWPMQADTQPIRGDGRFKMSLLPTGLWDFDLLLGRDPDNAEPLLSIHQVAIQPFQLTRDPRLQEVDLLALVRLVAVNVRVPGGAPADKGTVARAAAGRKGKGQLSVPLKDGQAILPCVTVPVDLAIVVPGFLLQTVRGIEGSVDVSMARGLPVRVIVSGHNERQPDWLPVRVVARPRDDALASVWPGDPVALVSGEASFILPAAGRYRARIEFAPPPDPSSGQDPASAEARRRNRVRSEVDFEVKDADREQLIELAVKR